MDCFAEPVIGQRFALTRWLAMTAGNNSLLICHALLYRACNELNERRKS
jgi:hypothetical protein